MMMMFQNGGKSGWKQWEAVRFDSVQFDEYDRVGDSRFKLEPGSGSEISSSINCAPLGLCFIREDGGPEMRTPSTRDKKGHSAP